MGGIVSGITGAVGAQQQEDEAKRQLEAAQRDRQAGVQFAENLDWSPERVRDQVGTFKRSESPIADAFLQSFLTGDNPAGIQGTRAGAKFDKADAQQRFNTNFGGWDALRARQREVDASTPWKLPMPTGKTYDDKLAAGPEGQLSEAERKKLRDLTGGMVDSSGKWIGSSDGTNSGYASYSQLTNDPFHSGGSRSRGLGGNRHTTVTPKKIYDVGTPDYLARVRRYMALVESGMNADAAAKASFDEFAEAPPQEGGA